MGRVRELPNIDPATKKPLPAGVQYRGPAQYRARKLAAGKRVTKTFETAKLAAAWITEVQADSGRGRFVDTSKAERISLGSVLRSYQLQKLGDDPQREPCDDDGKTLDYDPIETVSHRKPTELFGAAEEIAFIDVILRDEICRKKMARLSGADTSKFRDRMKAAGYAPATIVRRLNIMARAITVARSEWEINIPFNPADSTHCARPRGADRKRERILLPAPSKGMSGGDSALSEEERLLQACAGDQWLLAAVQLALATAMRQGEICALEWSDVDLESRRISVKGPERSDGIRVTKNRTVRFVPMLDDSYAILSALPRGRDKRVIKLEQNALKMRYRRAVKTAGLENLTFHDLRHAATSRLAEIYKDPLTLRLVTGHKDLKSLARYFHKTNDDLLAEAGVIRSR